jgi:YfiH family protein
MNYLNKEKIKKYKDFLIIEDGEFNVVFSTAEKGRSFNRHTESGVATLESLKEDFSVNEVMYLKQIHSDEIYVYNLGDKELKDKEGDAIITNEKDVIVGAFTADCVPVILVDDKKKAVAAIHSGWKGTFNSITKKTVERLVKEFDTDVKNIKAYIGPHIRQCCYEISEELKEQFVDKINLPKEQLFNGRKLNMEMCIESDLIKCGVKEENIYALPLCTYCESNIKLHSYRKTSGTYGRLFSFVFMKG